MYLNGFVGFTLSTAILSYVYEVMAASTIESSTNVLCVDLEIT